MAGKRDATKIQEMAKAGISRLANEKIPEGLYADLTDLLVDIASTAAVMDARTGKKDPSERAKKKEEPAQG